MVSRIIEEDSYPKRLKRLFFVSKPYSEHFAENYLPSLTVKYEKIITDDVFKLERQLAKIPSDSWVWVEWANTIARRVLSKRRDFKVLVRVHDYEVTFGYAKRIDWKNCDLIWFINRETRKDFFKLIPECRTPAFFLPNAVNYSKLKIPRFKKLQKNIAAISVRFNPRKNYTRLIRLLEKVLKLDPDWKLYIKAQILTNDDRTEYEKCIREATSRGIIDRTYFVTNRWDWKNISEKKDISKFFKDKDIIASVSNHEGFHYVIAEGALCGLMPAVYNWEWGRAKDFWKPYVKDSLDQLAINIVAFGNRDKKRRISEIKSFRDYVKKKFGPKYLVPKLESLLFMNRKLMFITHDHPFRFNPRGAEKSIQIIINYLYKMGYDICVVVRNMRNNFDDYEEKNGVRYYTEPVDNITHESTRFKFKLSLIIEKEKPDLVITYSTAAKVAYPVLIDKGLNYILLVRWFRLIQPLPPGDMLFRSIDKNFVDEHKEIFENATSIITNNKYSCQVIKRYYNCNPVCRDIVEYSSSNNFKNLLLELNLDDLWENCQRRVHRTYRSNLSYIEENKEALGLMLTIFRTKLNKEEFLFIISDILIDFARWEIKKDFSKIKDNLIGLGYSDDELKELFKSLKKTKIQSTQYHKPRISQKFSKKISFGIALSWVAITLILWAIQSFFPPDYQLLISLIKLGFTAAGPIGLVIFLIRRE